MGSNKSIFLILRVIFVTKKMFKKEKFLKIGYKSIKKGIGLLF
jgi:hypothetical protein